MSGPLREVNQTIRDLAANLASHEVSDWEFVCECGEHSCTETVGLALALYDDLKDADVPLLAPGHPLGRTA
jgi:hypothetical protein